MYEFIELAFLFPVLLDLPPQFFDGPGQVFLSR